MSAGVALSLATLAVLGFVITSWSFLVDHPFKYVHLFTLFLVSGAILYQKKLPYFGAYVLFIAWYLVGITELLSFGIDGALIECCVVATFFLGALTGARGTIIGVAICLLSALIVATLLHNGWLTLSGDESSLPLSWSGWVYPLLSIPLFAGSISGATAYLTNQLGTSLGPNY